MDISSTIYHASVNITMSAQVDLTNTISLSILFVGDITLDMRRKGRLSHTLPFHALVFLYPHFSVFPATRSHLS